MDGREVSDEEWEAHVVEASRWCYKNKKEVRVLFARETKEPVVLIYNKPRKVQKPSWVKQKERAAIDRLLKEGL